jgi:TRAP transporter TAXI family solute receptor
MKKALLLGLVAALVLGLGMVPGAAMAKDYSIKIGGGPTGGTFNTFANGMAVYVPKVNKNIKATAVGSGGSVENVKRVSRNESNFGMCYAVDSDLGFQGKLPKDTNKYNGLRAMGYLYGAPAQLIVRADSKIKSAMDLKGKRVAVGNAGSGAAASAERFFRHIGCGTSSNPPSWATRPRPAPLRTARSTPSGCWWAIPTVR